MLEKECLRSIERVECDALVQLDATLPLTKVLRAAGGSAPLEGVPAMSIACGAHKNYIAQSTLLNQHFSNWTESTGGPVVAGGLSLTPKQRTSQGPPL